MQLCETDAQCPGGETCTRNVDGPGGDPCFMEPGYGTNMQPAPFYEWNNTVSGSMNVTDPDVDFTGDAPLEAGRDYHDDTPMPGYVPLEYPHPLTCLLN